MKAQSLIFQFILFFMIGLVVFLSVGNIFKIQSEIIRKELIDNSLKLVNSFISSGVVISAVSCKQCDFVSCNIITEKNTVGFYTDLKLSNGVNITAGEKYFHSSVHKINESSNLVGFAMSIRPITLTFERTKNKLMIFNEFK